MSPMTSERVRAPYFFSSPMKLGRTIRDIAAAHPTEFVKFHSGILELHRQLAAVPPVRREIRVTILWGTTGVGKTHRVLTKYPEAYPVGSGRDPFGNYSEEAVVFWDEFNWRDWKVQDMLKYLDVWRCKLDCRYHDKFARWSRVFLLSNTDPNGWFPYDDELVRAAFMRRIHEIVEVNSREQVVDI